jgi:hypothetical protein
MAKTKETPKGPMNEPVAIGAIVRSALTALMAFGIGLTAEQVAAVVIVAEMISGFVIRQSVTPNRLAEHRVNTGRRPTDSRRPLVTGNT